MQPTVEVQLMQFQRILNDDILPAISDELAADTLFRVAADLRKLASCWEAALPFTLWDIERIEAVLCDLNFAKPEPIADRSGWTYADLCAHQQHLRSVLDQAVSGLPERHTAPQKWMTVISYFRERLDADPMTNRSPKAQGTKHEAT